MLESSFPKWVAKGTATKAAMSESTHTAKSRSSVALAIRRELRTVCIPIAIRRREHSTLHKASTSRRTNSFSESLELSISNITPLRPLNLKFDVGKIY